MSGDDLEKSGGGVPAVPRSKAQALLKKARQHAPVPGAAGGGPARFAFAIDATASMDPLIAMAREAIAAILAGIHEQAGKPVHIQFFAYRDYDIPDRLIEVSPESPDAQTLLGWLAQLKPAGGGAYGSEAVEQALSRIAADGGFHAVFLAGDEPSHTPKAIAEAGIPQQVDARTLARRLGSAKTPIHTFVIGSYKETEKDFQEIARLSGGRSGRLDGSAEMTDMAVMAMLAALEGRAAVARYMGQRALSRNAREFATRLIGPGNS